MLLWLSQFYPFATLHLISPIPSDNPPLSTCPCVMHLSSLVSPFPILFLTSPCLFCTYQFVLLIPCTFSPILPLPPPK